MHFKSEELIQRFFRYIDDEKHLEASALFAEDGVWLRQQEVLTGQSGVLQSLTDNPPLMPTCHLLTNFLVTKNLTQEVHAVFYITAFRSTVGAKLKQPLPIDLPVVVALYKTAMAVVDDQWRIKQIESRAIFRR